MGIYFIIYSFFSCRFVIGFFFYVDRLHKFALNELREYVDQVTTVLRSTQRSL